MIYMVEFDFSDPMLLDEWNKWYEGQIIKLLALPGFRTVQRFKAVEPVRSPYLAIYDIDSREVFSTPEYLAKGGRGAPGKWAPLMIDWDRNIFPGVAPAVPMDSLLIIVDRLSDKDQEFPVGLNTLQCIGLDHTIHQRGYALSKPGTEEMIVKQSKSLKTRVFRPLWPQRRKPL